VLSSKRIGAAVWVLIYGGLLAASLGWFLPGADRSWSALLIGAGVLAVAAGAALIVLRSRMKE
jgi:hypothetical protein